MPAGRAQRPLVPPPARPDHRDGERMDGRPPARAATQCRTAADPVDHADWDELTTTIQELAPSEVWGTHGREEALVHWCMTRQIKARALALAHFEDEDD